MGKAAVFPRTDADAQWTEKALNACKRDLSVTQTCLTCIRPLISFGTPGIDNSGAGWGVTRWTALPSVHEVLGFTPALQKMIKKKIQMHSHHRDQGYSQTVPCTSLRNCSDSKHPNKSQVWRGTSVAQGLREMRWGKQPH